MSPKVTVKKTDWDADFPWSILVNGSEYDAYNNYPDAQKIAVRLSMGYENPERGIWREG